MARFSLPKMNLGMLCLSVWLIWHGLAAVVPSLPVYPVVQGIIAVAAGVLILLGR